MFRAYAVALLAVLSATSSPALASYSLFCELEGEVVSQPVRSETLAFDFAVRGARQLEVEGVDGGESDCHFLEGANIKVVLKHEDAGDLEQIVVGTKLYLERYEIDVIDRETGRVYRSIKHVRRNR